ncbi:mannitol dehydrogenase family protein [Elioraea sp.]|uniref:mannitol dehydrogenase family protein n=1 Tax=Elioraea sp. TaxID=2185103 RepID=UPI0025BC703A|nr:mannitol dehydrogenase family protein [Elioraea sp.]
MTARLSAAALGQLPASVARPRYDRAAITPGIVHLGLGAFHRGHQAVMTEAVLQDGAREWGIVAASLRSPATRDALAVQDRLYTVATREDDSEALAVIGSLCGLHVAPEDPAALLRAMADPRVRIVSLTVTEKGYCHDPASGELDEAHPDIRHDLATPQAPRSAPGLLVEALRLRRAAGVTPFTVLCCDNLPANGATVRRVAARLGALREPGLGAWIAGEVAFPCTMVDRIVPATTQEDRSRIAAALGCEDAWPVVGEAFSQWVIEDHFPTGRPGWEAGGATFAADVAPYELMKLRMLNAAHSALAYVGHLAGHETVADASNDPVFAAFLHGLWAEIIPCVPAPPGVDLHAHAARLLARFRNRALRHRTWQIAMDGSQKLPPRLLETVRARLAAGQPIAHLALAVAGWVRYVSGTGDNGAPIDVRDPLATPLRQALDAAGDEPSRQAAAALGFETIFGPDLARSPAFQAAVAHALGRLRSLGARDAARAVTLQDG